MRFEQSGFRPTRCSARHLAATNFWRPILGKNLTSHDPLTNNLFWWVVSFLPVEEDCQTDFVENDSLPKH